MAISGKRLTLAVLAGAVVLLFAPSVRAQFSAGPRVLPNSQGVVNPYYRVGNPYLNLSLNQAAYNTAVTGNALAQMPPWTYGYNPYPSPIYNTGPVVANPALAGASSLTSVGYPYSNSFGSYYNSPGYGGMSPYWNSSGSNGYWPYNPYYYGSYIDPNSGFLYGTASVINASGQYAVQLRQASLIGQQVEQARVDTRRKIIDQWLYERAVLPTNQDERERVAKLELRRAMTDPPTSEILGATTLNRLYKDAREKLTKGVKGQPIPLDEAVLKQINVTTSAGNGNVGALKPVKDGGTLNWPPVLLGEGYADEVQKINQRAAELVKDVEFKGAVDPGRLQDLTAALNRLQAKVNANVGELTPSQWIEAKRFLGQLEEARKALGKADVANYFTNKFTAKGKTVPELVQHMADKGLEFAPSTNGDEAAYVALYNYLLAYLNSVNSGGRE